MSENDWAVHLFGTLVLPQATSRDDAYDSTLAVAQEQGRLVVKQGDNQFIVLTHIS